MSESKLPERASLEFLKKLAKDRLRELRRSDPGATLAAALLSVAREHGFASWRALKAAVDARQEVDAAAVVRACAAGDVDAVRTFLAHDPSWTRKALDAPLRHHGGWTALHEAAKAGQLGVVRLLLESGADPNAREDGDNTYPLHWAAALGHTVVVRALLDAGTDVHGYGDLHEQDVIGWATVMAEAVPAANQAAVVALLLERGARHHIFSAIATGDLALIRRLVEENPDALERRRSRFEGRQTPLHYAMSQKRPDIVALLIELGADVEAADASGQTPLAVAMLKGDAEVMRLLHAAGAKAPETTAPEAFLATMTRLGGSVKKSVAMIGAPDVAAALEWYTSIGFTELTRYGDDGVLNFGALAYGESELMLNRYQPLASEAVSLWFQTDQVDALYQQLKARQLAAAQAALTGAVSDERGVVFQQDIEDMFYGARQFGIRDLNGYTLYFIQHKD